MDRRQRKTREAIFTALTDLLSVKEFGKITVGEIIQRADVGRATFYAHFETKEFLLKELCAELFCHVFDGIQSTETEHRHIFTCEESGSVFLHLFRHLKNDDNHILKLLSCSDNELFLQYFKSDLLRLAENQLPMFLHRKNECLPDDFWADHIASTFVDTLRWWVKNGMQQSPELITEYFFHAV